MNPYSIVHIQWTLFHLVGFHHVDFPNEPITLRLEQNGRHQADGIFKGVYLNENDGILIQISLKFFL